LSRFVLDASVALSWCFEDESGRTELAILDTLKNRMEAVVPAVWPFEILAGGLSGERRGRIAPTTFRRFLHELVQLRITVDQRGLDHTLDQVNQIGRSYGLTSYDAAYLELALRMDLPLLTLDAKLVAAARKAGLSTALPH
jgi:predicted nucleic acid-binding protein